jgi:hypothetical protein
MAMIWRSCRCRTISVMVGCLFSFSLPAYAGGEGLYLVAEVNGNVSVQVDGRKFRPAKVGDQLKSADKLSVGKGGRAKVLCQNAVIWPAQTVGTFFVSQGCQANGRAIFKSANLDRIPTRSGNNSDVPYVISPRNSRLIGSEVLLRWNPVGGKKYRVSVTGLNLNWETTVDQSQVMYSGRKALKPGMRYRVIVTAENGASSQSDGVTGFSILNRDSVEVRQIKADIAALQQQDLSEEAQVLALAHLERSNELYESAIDRLEKWLKNGKQSAMGSKLLGDLYWQVGLPGLAREHYTMAQKLMSQDKNQMGEAEVLRQLGVLERGAGELKAAIARLEAAKLIYQSVEDSVSVREIEVTLADLKKRI